MISILLTTLLGNLDKAHLGGCALLLRPASRRELYSSAFVCILPPRNLSLCLASMGRSGLDTVAATAHPPGCGNGGATRESWALSATARWDGDAEEEREVLAHLKLSSEASAGKIRILQLSLLTRNFHKTSNMVKSAESVRFGQTQGPGQPDARVLRLHARPVRRQGARMHSGSAVQQGRQLQPAGVERPERQRNRASVDVGGHQAAACPVHAHVRSSCSSLVLHEAAAGRVGADTPVRRLGRAHGLLQAG